MNFMEAIEAKASQNYNPQRPIPKYVKPTGEPMKAKKWIASGILPPDLTMFNGDRSVGKTNTLADLMLAVAFPEKVDVLGLESTPRRQVLWVMENADQQWKNIFYGPMNKHDISEEELLERITFQTPEFETAAHVAKWTREDIDADPARFFVGDYPPVIIFDTVASCFNILSENDNAEIQSVLDSIRKNLLFDTPTGPETPVVLVAHTAKAQNGGQSLSARGAGTWEGVAGHVLALKKTDASNPSCPRMLVCTKNRLGSEGPVLITRATESHTEVVQDAYNRHDSKGAIKMVRESWLVVESATPEEARETWGLENTERAAVDTEQRLGELKEAIAKLPADSSAFASQTKLAEHLVNDGVCSLKLTAMKAQLKRLVDEEWLVATGHTSLGIAVQSVA
jgi:hypothetical protein